MSWCECTKVKRSNCRDGTCAMQWHCQSSPALNPRAGNAPGLLFPPRLSKAGWKLSSSKLPIFFPLTWACRDCDGEARDASSLRDHGASLQLQQGCLTVAGATRRWVDSPLAVAGFPLPRSSDLESVSLLWLFPTHPSHSPDFWMKDFLSMLMKRPSGLCFVADSYTPAQPSMSRAEPESPLLTLLRDSPVSLGCPSWVLPFPGTLLGPHAASPAALAALSLLSCSPSDTNDIFCHFISPPQCCPVS